MIIGEDGKFDARAMTVRDNESLLVIMCGQRVWLVELMNDRRGVNGRITVVIAKGYPSRVQLRKGCEFIACSPLKLDANSELSYS